jgi:hypothetical protein
MGSALGSDSVETTDSNTDLTSAYGALDAQRKLTVLLINKGRNRSAEMMVNLSGFATRASASLYRYGQSDLSKIEHEEVQAPDPSGVKVSVPPLSIALLVLEHK